MTAKRKTTAKKRTLSYRFGKVLAKHGPGTVVKTGRLAKKASVGIGRRAVKIKDGFVEGWDEV